LLFRALGQTSLTACIAANESKISPHGVGARDIIFESVFKYGKEMVDRMDSQAPSGLYSATDKQVDILWLGWVPCSLLFAIEFLVLSCQKKQKQASRQATQYPPVVILFGVKIYAAPAEPEFIRTDNPGSGSVTEQLREDTKLLKSNQ